MNTILIKIIKSDSKVQLSTEAHRKSVNYRLLLFDILSLTSDINNQVHNC